MIQGADVMVVLQFAVATLLPVLVTAALALLERRTRLANVSWGRRQVLYGIVFGLVDVEPGYELEPDAALTRDFAAFSLNQLAGYLPEAENYTFSDADDVSSWAVASVGWCFANELTTGFDGLIDPQGEATRAETASMAYQLYLLIEG